MLPNQQESARACGPSCDLARRTGQRADQKEIKRSKANFKPGDAITSPVIGITDRLRFGLALLDGKGFSLRGLVGHENIHAIVA